MILSEAIEILKTYKQRQIEMNLSNSAMSIAIDTIIKHLEPKELKVDKEKGFEAFWLYYPKKVDKKNALKKWKSAKLYLISDVIAESLGNQLKLKDERFQREKQYIKSPLVYLNGECWNDEIITKQEDSKEWLTDDQVDSMARVGESFEDLFKRLASAGYNFNRSR